MAILTVIAIFLPMCAAVMALETAQRVAARRREEKLIRAWLKEQTRGMQGT